MRNNQPLPRRLGEDKKVQAMLADQLPMATIVDHRRNNRGEPTTAVGPRTLKTSVQVQVWCEADGSEWIVVTGDESVSNLELKGLLHDGIYALAHEGEPGYTRPVASA